MDEDDFDSDDFDDAGSDVSLEESILVKPEYFETTVLRFHSLTQSPCGAFDKNSVMHLKWYGLDKNAKFVYGVLFEGTLGCKFLQIVKFCPVTSGFYVVKRFDDGKLYRALGFDDTTGTFLIAKSGTAPTVVLYNATSDFEACYRVKNGGDNLFTFGVLEALPCIGRREWILFAYHKKFFQRVIFDEGDMSVSLSIFVLSFPPGMLGVEQVFIYDKDRVIFVENWNKIFVYNLENGQFNGEDFTIDGITEGGRPDYWVPRLNVKSVRDLYVFSRRYGVLKLDFAAKKWRHVDFSFFVGDLSVLVNGADFNHHFEINDRYCTLIGVPEGGCFCALFTEISAKPVVDDEMRNKNGEKRKNEGKTEDRIAHIVCFLSSTCLQDLCLAKLFVEFRKNKGAEKITDFEFCKQIGISSDLIQKYIGSSGV